MLEKALLVDFQCHKNTLVEFDPRITCLVCESDEGKSAFLRGLRWLCLNDRRGLGFLGKWGKAKVCKSKLWVDGHRIVRKKGKGVNSYILDGKKLEFGIGEHSKVPEKIANILKLSPINFQNQHTLPFWFSESAGKVSKELNSVVDLGIIDETLANINQEVRKAKLECQITAEKLKEAKQEKKQLSWIPPFTEELTQMEVLQEKIVSLMTKRKILRDLVEQTRKARKLARQEVPDMTDMEGVLLHLSKLKKKRKAISSIYAQIDQIRDSIQDLSQELVKKEKDLEKKINGKCPVCGSELKKGGN